MQESLIPSPCNGVCTLDPKTDICLGCFRTRHEIAAWRASNDTMRKAIMDRIAARKAAQ